MPNGDGTGPNGKGPMTGRKAGFCSGNNASGERTASVHNGCGRGQGFGRGRGLGRGMAFRHGQKGTVPPASNNV